MRFRTKRPLGTRLPTIMADLPRSTRREIARLWKRKRVTIPQWAKDLTDDGAPATADLPCAVCVAEGRGPIPMRLHPKPDYYPCPTGAIKGPDGKLVGFTT